MAPFLALLSALSFGIGDFLGGIATRRSSTAIAVTAVSQVGGLAMILALLPVFPGEWGAEIVVRGSLAGLAGTSGVAFLYRGMGKGRMGLVAPVTAIGAALIPVLYGLLNGEAPGGIALSGVALGIAALPLLTRGHEADRATSTGSRLPAGLVDGVIAGLGFAVFFIILDTTADGTGVVPLVAARLTTIPVFTAVALWRRQPLRLPAGALRLSLAAGATDMLANAFFLGAVRTGFLTLTSVIASLYPGLTVALAWLVADERIERHQAIGLAVALAAVALMAAG